VTRGRPYRACTAQTQAAARVHQPRRPRKLLDPWPRQYARNLPDSGVLARSDCRTSATRVSWRHGQTAFDRNHLCGPICAPRGALRSELLAVLRQARKARRPLSRGTDRRGQIPNMTPIAERPADVAICTVAGHWEGDLIKVACNGSAVGTLVERATAWSSWPG
jgi:IS30 family transposase